MQHAGIDVTEHAVAQAKSVEQRAKLGNIVGEILGRDGRKMELTSRAEGLKDAVRDVLVRVDANVAAQPQFVPAQSNRLFQMLVSDYTMMTLMPYVLELDH